jgi:pyruvate formate lyase activating enzyme
MDEGVIFDIKKFAIDDGPGIRTTVFLKGCPLQCWWCHNPEGQSSASELMHRKNICISCQECARTCTQKALSFKNKQLMINRKKCNLCESCVRACPSGALTIVGKKMKTKEVMEEINKDLAFYSQSHGGVTFSGGEPLMQPSFLNTILTECKKTHIHTALDTSGYASSQTIEKIKNKIDLFLYDLKIIDETKHKKFTGVSNKPIIKNFQKLAKNGNNVLVRFPVIPKITDDENNVSNMANLISSCDIEHVCLLPYHKSGIEKYRSVGRNYILETTETPSNRKLDSIKKQFEAIGLHVTIGG